MKNLILIFGVVAMFSSCERVRIEPDKRIEIAGTLLDENGEGISGISVFALGVRNSIQSAGTNNILGKTKTDAAGNFKFVSLDSYNRDFGIAVNPTGFEESVARTSLYYLDEADEHQEQYACASVNLPKKVDFRLHIENTSATQDTLIYSIRHEAVKQFFEYQNGSFNRVENLEDNLITLREHRPNSEPINIEFSAPVGTEIKLTYNLGENPIEEVIIFVTPETTSYDLEY